MLCCLLQIQRSLKIAEKSENIKEVIPEEHGKETKQKVLSYGKNVILFVTGFIHRSDSDIIVLLYKLMYITLTAL